MVRRILGTLVIVSSLALTGCATIVKGASQEVRVSVTGPSQADCKASNSAGQWHLRAPTTVSVQRSHSGLSVICEAEGYKPATRVLNSSFNGATLGNVLLGGVIGAAIDAGSGANYSYPESVQLTLDPACAPDDADCLAKIAAVKQRKAQEAAAAEAAQASAQATLNDPNASATEKEAALAAEQGQFEAWYATNQDQVEREINSHALRENIYSADCGLGGVRITEKRVSDLRREGFVVDLRWWKPGKYQGCEVHRHDRFLLRIEDDRLRDIEHLGPGAQSAATN